MEQRKLGLDTEMTDTPERIWAFTPDIFDNCSLWQDAPSPAGDTIEYVRADHLEELSNCAAVLEAKLTRAMDALKGVKDFVVELGEYADPSHKPVPALVLACATYEELTGGKDE